MHMLDAQEMMRSADYFPRNEAKKYACMLASVHRNTRTNTHARMHTHMHTHARMRAHTHRHMHACVYTL